MTTQQFWGRIFLLPFLFCSTSYSTSASAVEAHHFFNANLLNPQEYQISILGNAKYGVSKNWEIGLSAPIFYVPNIYIKHQMFEVANHKTAFVAHYLLTFDFFAGYHGLVHSVEWEPGYALNFGVFQSQLRAPPRYFDLENKKDVSEQSRVSLMLGYDQDVTPRHWYFNATLLYPIYQSVNIESASGDYSVENSPSFEGAFSQDAFPLNAPFIFTTFTYRASSFHFEFGTLNFVSSVGMIPIPYLNLFWRFGHD